MFKKYEKWFTRYSAIFGQDLLYDYYPVLWELKEEMEYMSKWISWKQSGAGKFKYQEMVPRRQGIIYEIQKVVHSN